tara:strand:- start:595 stop:858 length:264 start_codon:yes stop_codon:yes gene_type:complete
MFSLLFQDEWFSILPSPLVAITIYRHPVEVAHSLLKRDRIPLREGADLWMRYVCYGLRSSELLPHVVVGNVRRITEDPLRILEVQKN